jgi:hypothetical protein
MSSKTFASTKTIYLSPRVRDMISSVVSLAVALPRARFNQACASRRRVAAAGFISTPFSTSSNTTSVSGNKPNFSRSACGIVTWPLLVSFTVILFANQYYSSREAFTSSVERVGPREISTLIDVHLQFLSGFFSAFLAALLLLVSAAGFSDD